MIKKKKKKKKKLVQKVVKGREYLVRIIMPLLLIENKENIVDRNDV